MSYDPGTIYSDDEIECFSGSDEEEPVEDFNRLTEYSSDGYPEREKPKYLKNYLDDNGIVDLDKLIECVRTEDTKKEDRALPDCPSEDEEGNVRLRKANVRKEEDKRERKAKETEQLLKKDKEKIDFEDAPPFTPGTTFLEMNLSPILLKTIAMMNYQMPTPIQAMTIPIALKGRDICGCSATGTGKTAAFMIPILQRFFFKPHTEAMTRALILVPTRELGVQVFEVSKELSRYLNITISLAVGGLSREVQIEELQQKPDIIVATPGRLIDHMHNMPTFALADVEILVVDEADRILDEFFTEQLTEIVRQCRITRQTMLFSATMTEKVKELVTVSLKKPVRIFVNSNTDVAQNLHQEFIRLRENSDEVRMAVLAYLLTRYFRDECMVFVPRKKTCHQMRIKFGLLGLKCGELHSEMKQHERLSSLERFKNKEFGVLFATDVAGRGLDIKGVKTVINFTLPNTYQMYVHRVGRTARAGYSGRSISIAFDTGRDYSLLRKIKKFSLSPLYERTVKSKHIDVCIQKLKDLEPSVDKVLQLEVEEKVREVGAAVKDLRDQIVGKDGLPKKGNHSRSGKGLEHPPPKKGKWKKARELSQEDGKNKRAKLKPQIKPMNNKKKIKEKNVKEVTSFGLGEKKRKSNFEEEIRMDAPSGKKKSLVKVAQRIKRIGPLHY